MNRRNALRNISGLAMASAAAVAIPNLSQAQVQPTADLSTRVQIGSNHGHSLNLTITDVIKGMRNGGINAVSIQGGSGHGHTVDISQGDLLKLIFDGEIETLSSQGRGHTHEVTIRLS